MFYELLPIHGTVFVLGLIVGFVSGNGLRRKWLTRYHNKPIQYGRYTLSPVFDVRTSPYFEPMRKDIECKTPYTFLIWEYGFVDFAPAYGVGIRGYATKREAQKARRECVESNYLNDSRILVQCKPYVTASDVSDAMWFTGGNDAWSYILANTPNSVIPRTVEYNVSIHGNLVGNVRYGYFDVSYIPIEESSS